MNSQQKETLLLLCSGLLAIIEGGIFLSIIIVPIGLIIIFGIPYAAWRHIAEPKPHSLEISRFFKDTHNVLWKSGSTRRSA